VGTATIERWAGVFGANAPPAGTLNVTDDGIGRLFASRSADFPSELLYAPQLATCGAAGTPCFDHCTSQPTCGRVHLDHPGSMGTHVNGAVLHGPLTAYTTDTDKRVYVASTSCIGMVPSTCTPRTIVDGMLDAAGTPSASHYVGMLSREPIDGLLWWTTIDDQDGDTCLYRAPMPGTLPPSDCTNCNATCAVSSAAIPSMWGVTTSELGVFVGTKIPPSVFPNGPIFVVDRTTLTSTPLFHTTARFPAAADDRLLYALDAGTSPGRLVALDVRSSAVVASAALPSQGEGEIFAVDASSRDWVYFTSEHHLFRWRKPPAP
jgi:hypothetical protein